MQMIVMSKTLSTFGCHCRSPEPCAFHARAFTAADAIGYALVFDLFRTTRLSVARVISGIGAGANIPSLSCISLDC
jgi:hypothetical protein